MYYELVELTEAGSVVWAADNSVPVWFDIARDFTERWVHQRHIRDAIRRVDELDRFLPEVLRTFVWAYPHQYRANAAEGTVVEVDLDVGGRWFLERGNGRWTLNEGPGAGAPDASLRLSSAVAWRQLTGLASDDPYVAEGETSLLEPLLEVRAIIT